MLQFFSTTLVIFISVINLTHATANHHFKLYNTTKKSFENYKEVVEKFPTTVQLILGEYHYTPKIQKAQGKIIKDIVTTQGAQGNFHIGWEFLNFTDQELINQKTDLYKKGKLDEKKYLNTFFKGKDIYTYSPILKTLKELDGTLIGLNLPRKYKRQIFKDGMESIPEGLIPDGFKLGGKNYLERFKEAMQGHVHGEKLQKYFLLQCLTDHVLGHYHNNRATKPLSFMIVGSFHSDYNDGTVKVLKDITKNPVVTMKLIDASKMTDKDMKKLTVPHKKYGPLADYILFITR